ncbi:MAG: hypothetical protein IID45_04460 [Planctomycetes bacterium]|nr:hypothetical protein [Planctomycetota bacterium]
MSRSMIRLSVFSAAFAVTAFSSADAQVRTVNGRAVQPQRLPQSAVPVQSIPRQRAVPGYPVYYAAPNTAGKNRQPAGAARVPARYPYLNAPLYSSPVQNVPYQVGGTMITNQAFAPHEMLYPHTYRALYPPYYYRVRGSWIVWPWGVESYDRWKLMGTEVKVEYSSSIPFFSRFTRPLFR